mmetsp:Transcript_40335/g.121520  ORF Transcript_40335/g.121520 Transcript_40335/m.121520 type:complete len:309 (-) Transcript_40335:328-1254(-)|eukprot:CAMPEP_0113549578 /NCGR_PEP_ID=MMETSP0015_2-20120614/13509_1 /TAXON_ID=2838 /ORGANISM="Odontella" /LENGTH=308 /DNA_ID=CAMNT_0000450299 /DNA_START=147 /DNA_END=1073 /DNA_ORIENTATION=- /assembly_acc=CAM_ASM_000160
MEDLLSYLTADFRLASELQCFWMAVQGSMAVRKGPNKDGKMDWFHAFALSIMTAYAGASFTALWMGRPTSMLSNDLNMTFCIIAFVITNYTPFDVGYKVLSSIPFVLVTTGFAQLFRGMGLIKFSDVAQQAFEKMPSEYYPTPIFGPILLPVLLGNMGGFFSKGFHGHLEKGMPWPVQNGLFCASFYHFFIHDQEGFVGKFMRRTLGHYPAMLGLDDKTFAIAFVNLFMQVVGILQLPDLLGPGFSPFNFVRPTVLKAYELVPMGAETKAGPGTPAASDANGSAATKKKKSGKNKAVSNDQQEKNKDL